MWVLILSSSAASHFWLVTFVFWLAGAQRDSSVQRESSICSLPKKLFPHVRKLLQKVLSIDFRKCTYCHHITKLVSVRGNNSFFSSMFLSSHGIRARTDTLRLSNKNLIGPTKFLPFNLIAPHITSSPAPPRMCLEKVSSTCNKNDTIKRFPFVMGFHSVSSCFVFVFYHLYTLSLHHAHIQNFTWSSWKTVRKLFYVQFCYYSEFSPFVSSITIKWSSVHITHIKMCVCVWVRMFQCLHFWGWESERVRIKIEKVQKCFSNYFDIVRLVSQRVWH